MNLMLFAPELLLMLGSLLIFMQTLSSSDGQAAGKTALALGIVSVVLGLACLGNQGELFFKAYRVDLFSQLFKLAIAVGFTVVVAFGRRLKDIRSTVRAEYYLFLVLSCLGLMMLVSSVELISLFVALELSSFSLYVLVPLRGEGGGLRTQMEAAIKYIMYGVVATGVMLFGMSYLFGLTGTTYLGELVPKLAALHGEPAVYVGIGMLMSGFFFKLAVFPFHFWVPDVYEGAANETTAFIASVPKLAAVAMLIRAATLVDVDGQVVVKLLTILAVCSMFYGNLVALVQKDLKRMLGFSGIAHAGYILLGILTLQKTGYATSMYYIFGYLVMNLACFLVICTLSEKGANVKIEDLTGLHRRAPLLAFIMAVGMFALAGIPPFVGFMGKFMLLAGALKAGHLNLVILAAINTAISIYYYLSVVRVTYCSNGAEKAAVVEVDGVTKILGVALVVAIIVMGVLPSQILEIAQAAVGGIF